MNELAFLVVLISCALFCTLTAAALLASDARGRRRGEREKGEQ